MLVRQLKCWFGKVGVATNHSSAEPLFYQQRLKRSPDTPLEVENCFEVIAEIRIDGICESRTLQLRAPRRTTECAYPRALVVDQEGCIWTR
jgi:hypothetical protein